MEKIILATDFTGCSQNAMEYATGIAKKAYADLVLFHAVTVPVIDPMAPTFYVQPVLKEQHTAADKELSRTVNELKKQKYPDQKPFRVEGITRVGETAIELNELASKIPADLIVVGSKGEDLATRFAGSTTEEVSTNSFLPVLVVPSLARFHGFQKIIYAAGLHEKDKECILHLASLASIFNAQLSVIHINTKNEIAQDEHFKLLKKDVLQELTYGKVDFESIHLENASAALDLVAQLDRADLLGMLKVKRNFFSDLFHKSLTKEKIYKSEIPVIVYHENE